MSTPTVSPAEAWRLSALATTVSRVLRQRYGTKKFYTEEQVEAVCYGCRVPSGSWQYAAAMFVEPKQSQGFLQRLGSSKSVAELRKFIAQQIFLYYLPGTSFDADTVDFHEAGPGGGATPGALISEVLSPALNGGGDSGGGDGGGGGGGGE